MRFILPQLAPHLRRPFCRHMLPFAALVLALILPLRAEQKKQPDQSRRTSAEKQVDPRPTSPADSPAREEDDEALAELLREGATMEEIAKLRDPIAKTPEEAIRALKTGNARFFGGTARRPELSANERRAQILAQHPFAVILGCSDSRVPTEIVYDQSLGSLFVVRVAGNVVEPATAGSVEYAIEHLKSHVITIMGHEGCGAVAAAMLPQDQREAEPQNVQFLLNLVRPAVEGIPQLRDKKARMREAVIANVRLQVHQMKQNPVVAAAIKEGRVQVIGAYYEIGSGAVDFLETDDELRHTAPGAREAAGSEKPSDR